MSGAGTQGTLAGQVALVTGGSGGIGRAACRELATRGATVWVHYHRGRDAAERTLESLPGGPHFTVDGDLCDPAAVRATVAAVIDGSGRLDVLVNNAGVFERHPPLTVDYDGWLAAWDRALDLNLRGPANACYWAARQMQQNGGGRIVNVSSRGAFRGEPESPAYGASKAGLNALTQSLAVALAPHGISVYAVAPGFVETAMARPYLTGEMAEAIRRQSPFGRVATVDDVAYWIGCLAEPRAAFASGTLIDVNGASYLRS